MPSSAARAGQKPLVERVKALVLHPQCLWALGHIVILFCFLRYSFHVVTFTGTKTSKSFLYRTAYTGAVLSYGIVVYKSYGVPKFDRAYLQKLLKDENVQYLLLAIYWYFQKPLYVTLIPYGIFAAFHSLQYIKASVIPTFFPPIAAVPPPTDGSPAKKPMVPGFPGSIQRGIQAFVKQNYDPAMRLVSFVEVVLVMGTVLVKALTFQGGLLTPLFYIHFLRLRFFMSAYTRSAMGVVVTRLDRLAISTSCPTAVRNAYFTLKDLITRYLSSVLQPIPATPPPPYETTEPSATSGHVGSSAAATSAPPASARVNAAATTGSNLRKDR